MITAQLDRSKLERSLKTFAKAFGDTNAQTIARWGVQVCREMAFETQAWGKTDAKKKQHGAIISDAYNVILVLDRVGKRNEKALRSEEDANEWIELNRTRRRARTAKLPISERKVCTPAIFKKAMKIRLARAGMAKGGWLGAGQEIASYQRGGEKITIGKNYLSWTKKHAHKGSATKPTTGFSPSIKLSNRAAHSSSPYVLSEAKSQKAIEWGLKKTVKWYSSALRAQDKAQKV